MVQAPHYIAYSFFNNLKTSLMKTKILTLLLLLTFQLSFSNLFAQNAPLDLQATASDELYQIVLTWTDSDESYYYGFTITKNWADGYMEHQSEIHIEHHYPDPFYIDTDVDPNITYTYSVGGISTYATLYRDTPPTPVNVSATAGEFMSVQISFIDNSDMETWYEVQHTSYLPDFTGDPNSFFGKKKVT
jgi:hypothetical protein